MPTLVGHFGGTLFHLYPTAFINAVSQLDNAIVIRTKKGIIKKKYIYFAVLKNYAFYTTTDEDLKGFINIDAECLSIFIPHGLKEVLI